MKFPGCRGGGRSQRALHREARRAFTLIELLVVIVILSVLAALLLPALSTAKQRARSLQCSSHLREWTQAFLMYKDEHEDFIPRECGSTRDGHSMTDSWAIVRNSQNHDVWYNALPPYLSDFRASSNASLISGGRALFYERKIFHCPSARFPAGTAVDNDARFSLAMNSKLIMPPAQNPEVSIKYATIQRPADTVAFLDARVNILEPKVDLAQPNTYLGQPSAFASRFAERHLNGGNLAFCDGHVEPKPGKEVVETRSDRVLGWGIFPDGDFFWCADPLEDPNRPD